MWKCMECGHKFNTTKAAERASFGNDGCPGCGGTDIDLDPEAPAVKAERERQRKPTNVSPFHYPNDG